jgi:spermidine synthase
VTDTEAKSRSDRPSPKRTAKSVAAPAKPFNGTGFLPPQRIPDENIRRPPPRPREEGDPDPFVVDDGVIRSLHFSPYYVQSEMSIDEPYTLKLAYTRQMMAFMLFLPKPKQVTIVGLGGGSLTKFCYRELPRASITTVEIDRGVINCAHYFQIPAENQRMRIVHADAVDYFAAPDERADVILIDGCDELGIVPSFGNAGFYQKLRAGLRPGGMLVVNLIGPDEVVDFHRGLIADTFDDRLLVQDVAGEGNRVAFAFNEPWREPDWPAIEREARKLARRHGLDFSAFARKLQRAYEQQPRRRGR